MKKQLLLSVAAIYAVALHAQQNQNLSGLRMHPESALSDINVVSPQTIPFASKSPAVTSTNSAISVIDIGISGNAYGMIVRQRTYLWADQRINTVSLVHRADAAPGTGFLQADFSKDGGATWSVNQGPVYSPGTGYANARYPQSLIYNPSGNTNPDNAFISFFAPTLNNTNALNWGGYVHGSYQINGGSNVVAPEESANANQGLFIPRGFTITQTSGTSFNLDMSERSDGGTSAKFTDSLIISKGTWNNTKKDFDYTRTFINTGTSKTATNLPVGPSDWRIAFAPDGNTGYIATINHTDFSFMPDSAYYLVVYKTVNGGSTWGSPVKVNVKSLVQPLLQDTGSKYTTGFELDLAVDINGNPHIITSAGMLGVNNNFSIITIPGQWGVFDFYSNNGGTTWGAILLARPQTFRGIFGDQSGTSYTAEDNHPQVSRTQDGKKLFFSWFDTDTINFGVDNLYPDWHCTGHDVTTNMWTQEKNLTTGTGADASVTFGNVSEWVLTPSAGTYELPCAFQFLSDMLNITVPVQLKYIKGAQFVDADFIVTAADRSGAKMLDMTAYPNPFSELTTLSIQIEKESSVTVRITNAMGQLVKEMNIGKIAPGSQTLQLNRDGLSSGVYFYTVIAGSVQSTGMLVIQ